MRHPLCSPHHHAEIVTAIKRRLTGNEPCYLFVSGTSMNWIIPETALIAVVRKGSPYSKGDIVAIDLSGTIVVHRIVSLPSSKVITKGDSRVTVDPAIDHDSILGLVKGIEHWDSWHDYSSTFKARFRTRCRYIASRLAVRIFTYLRDTLDRFVSSRRPTLSQVWNAVLYCIGRVVIFVLGKYKPVQAVFVRKRYQNSVDPIPFFSDVDFTVVTTGLNETEWKRLGRIVSIVQRQIPFAKDFEFLSFDVAKQAASYNPFFYLPNKDALSDLGFTYSSAVGDDRRLKIIRLEAYIDIASRLRSVLSQDPNNHPNRYRLSLSRIRRDLVGVQAFLTDVTERYPEQLLAPPINDEDGNENKRSNKELSVFVTQLFVDIIRRHRVVSDCSSSINELHDALISQLYSDVQISGIASRIVEHRKICEEFLFPSSPIRL